LSDSRNRDEGRPTRRSLSPWTYLGPYRGTLMVGGLMLLGTNALALAIPYVLGETIDALGEPNPAEAVPVLAMWMVILAAGQAILRIGSRTSIFNAAREAEHDLRSDLFAHLMKLEPAFYRTNPTGDVMSRLTNDVQTTRAMWGPGVLNIVNTSVLFSAALGLMLTIDPWLTLWAVLPYPGMIVLGRIFGRRLYRSSRGVQEQLGRLSSSIQEDLTGVAIIKAYTLEEERQAKFRGSSEVLLARNMELTKVRGQLAPALGGLASLGTVMVIWIGGQAVIEGRIDLGQLVQFNGYLAMLVWPTLALGWMLALFQRGLASWRRLEELLLTEPAIVSGPGPAIDPGDLRGHLELRHLTVRIGERTLLDDVSLELEPGTTTAFVGRTGSGKSTLVEVLPRLIDPPPGSVFLDGHDITELPLGTLRGAIGYAPQEAFLFSTTIARNISFGYAGETASEVTPRMQDASRAAGLTRDLEALPAGYDTVVGERGITLSGGQRQRVALARALASQPRVLILDDSLSSVDAETEREILEQLAEVLAGRTALLISHRVAAVKRADRIVVLDEGKVVEVGTHAELLARGGAYAELYRTQLEDELLGNEPRPEGAP
jgi:ATP-binding cassette, subfamily B, multidrug efflux pump